MRSRSPASHTFRCALPVLLLASLGLLPGCSARQSAAPAAAAQPAPSASSPRSEAAPAHQADPQLTAEIGFSHAQSLFRVENRDAFPWSNCQFILNAQGNAPGYTLAIASVKPGLREAVKFRPGDFTDAAGKRFDAAAGRVATLDLACDAPQGRLRAEQFLLGEPPGPSQPSAQGRQSGEPRPQ